MGKRALLGVVIIGRNEESTIQASIESASPYPLVYVDSGSSDQSVELAKASKAHVIELDDSKAYTAARGRNAGFRYLSEQYPDIQYIQFVDGDSTLSKGWLEYGAAVLEKKPRTAAVQGILDERYPDLSIYNKLCEMEWKRVVGPIDYITGLSMIRVKALKETGGYDETIIAGEEPELSLRFIKLGYVMELLDYKMATHDAKMLRFMQWWTRCLRYGHGFSEHLEMEGANKKYIREKFSTLFWAGVIPSLIILSLAFAPLFSVFIASSYVYLIWKIMKFRQRTYNDSQKDGILYACFLCFAKFPQLLGMCLYHYRTLFKKEKTLIE
jgi:glycosyltransferase involved in cell wall biosynthesis